MKSMNIEKIKFFDPKVIKNVQAKHLALFKDRVTEKGHDKDGKQFPKYSKGYIEALERDMRIKRGPRKGGRHKGLGGISLTTSGEKISRRQFRLRGITMGPNFKLGKHGSDYYELTWAGEGAQIVQWQAEAGRDVINDIPDKEWNRIVDMLGDNVDKQFNAIKNVKIRVG